MLIKTFVFLLFSFLVFGAVSPTTATKVSTPSATYTGSRLTLEHFDSVRPSSSVDQFLGIRYGQPPIRERRFKRSKPAWMIENSKGAKKEIDAKAWSPNCMQQPGFLELNLQTKERSEDCLHLNIWTPVSKNIAELKPVFLWFHSGAFISDSSSRKLYLGAHLAAAADAVVVTVNFRIDAFGFLFSGRSVLNGSEAAEGNLALWDQQLAMEWIQEHIEHFGGDPARVTIGGHGSGATSVGLHLLSAQSRQYFARALMMSGSVFAQLVTATKAAGEKVNEVFSLVKN